MCVTFCFVPASAGLEGDKDLKFLLDGGNLVKIRSGSWQKSRFFRLQEDCETLSYDSQKILKKIKTCKSCVLPGLHVLIFSVCMCEQNLSRSRASSQQPLWPTHPFAIILATRSSPFRSQQQLPAVPRKHNPRIPLLMENMWEVVEEWKHLTQIM